VPALARVESASKTCGSRSKLGAEAPMNEMILVAVVCFVIVAALYGVYGGLTAGADWKTWLLEQALSLYGVMLVGLAGLLIIVATVAMRPTGG
jgi:protein-S-isoprenylcysteine O-methyltransferase Ste14